MTSQHNYCPTYANHIVPFSDFFFFFFERVALFKWRFFETDVFLWLDNCHPDGGIVCDAGSTLMAEILMFSL